MIPKTMKTFLEDALPERVREKRLIQNRSFCFLEFGPLDVDSLQRLGIRVDRLGPRLVACFWDRESSLEIGGYLVVDNLAMGAPSVGGTRMLPDITPDIVHNLARGMTLKNAAADLPFGGGKCGIVCPGAMDKKERKEIVKGFGRLLKRYKDIYIPGPDVGTNDQDMKVFAIENGINNVVSKPADMGGNRIDELGAAAKGVVAAFNALVEHLPRLRELPQFKTMEIPPAGELDVLIQGFGAVGANTARLFHENTQNYGPRIKGISDATGYLLNPDGLPWPELFSMWKTLGNVAGAYYHDRIMHGPDPGGSKTVFSNNPDNLLTESAFCLIPASPMFNYLDVSPATSPSMTCDRMGKWQMIVEGANTYSPDPARKAQRRRMERHVFRDRGILIATDYLVNAGGVIYAAYERIIPTPHHLYIPKELLGDPDGIQGWLDKHRTEFQRLAEQRQKAALEKLKTVIPANMKELIQGLCRDGDSLPCEVAEEISVRRIASKEKSKTARDIMDPAPVIGLDRQITDAAELLVKSHVSIVTVVSEKGRPIGIITNWDITRAAALKLPMDAPLTKIMTTDLVSTGPDTSILNCIRMLENHEFSAMPVVDENRVLGIISGDILARKTLFRLLQTED